MKDTRNIKTLIGEHDIKFLDFRFTDTNGKWHGVTYDVDKATDNFLQHGFTIDGSSIPGWKEIHQSDIRLVPDLETAVLDPFANQSTLILFTDVHDMQTPYACDPRSIAKKAEQSMVGSGIADQAFFGPEPEFFIFDEAAFTVGPNQAAYWLHSSEMTECHGISLGSNGGMSLDGPLSFSSHRPGLKGGYLATQPLDGCSDMRGEMMNMLKIMGIDVEKHHHEVAAAQHEIGISFNTLVKAADQLQIFKYAVKNVAKAYGKTATFMPKPLIDDNGSGMHVHQSLWKKGKPLFVGDGYAGLSETALFYIGGILRHAQALNAFTNPTTNSYKRLVPGFEAPVILAYSFANRSAACRIPLVDEDTQRRIEIRFPDPSANPYLALAAMMMAGLDGIRHKIHPGEAVNENLFESDDEYPTLASSLEEALVSLEEDHSFLLHDNVFTKDMLESYIELKYMDTVHLQQHPHPLEFVMYYSG